MNQDNIEKVIGLINNFRELCQRYNESKSQENQDSFNIFKLISDRYYREDFHSDIMAFLLDPNKNHGFNDKFLRLFIDMLNAKINNESKTINIKLYDDADIRREFPVPDGRIDILIKSEKNKHVIIVENKINNASDTYRQLPKYYNYFIEQKYKVDAIIYLPLDIYKKPSKLDWTNNEISNVESKLLIIPAYSKSNKINIVDNWIVPASKDVRKGDVSSMLEQYADLVRKLNKELNKPIMNDFYEKLMEGDNLKVAKTIYEMLGNYQQYFAQKVTEKYQNNCNPFPGVSYVSAWGGYAYFQKIEKLNISMNVLGKIDYEGEGLAYTIKIENQSSEESKAFSRLTQKIKEIIPSNISENGYYDCNLNDVRDEKTLFEYIDVILKELSLMAKE